MRMLFSVSADFRELLPVVESRGRFGGDQHEKQDSGAGGEQDKATDYLLRITSSLKRNILYQQSETVKADYKNYRKPATASSESTADNRTGHKGGRLQLQNLPSSQKFASHGESPFKRHGLPPHNDHPTSA
ncbi:hypothetical protein G5714_010263 [Onychostoma macrolepis]|uniref:Uncharacterized protein n=1 Tax=Onychostoma macrolepis TaxID=369639 RepID=A0A7J6CPN6_9TELE|nr:hypothetical protein G5714_010263 [Onychostoma macrolepis]